jgi:glucosamine--fructose-6-phosphate aminotransferase (isomerizing)
MRSPIKNPFLSDVLRQPQVLRAALKTFSPSKLGTVATAIRSHQRIVLTGMGASFAALLPAWRALMEAGVTAWHLDTAELLSLSGTFLAPNTLVIAASQSGRSAELVSLAQQVHSRTALIAITNDANSPLAEAASSVIEIHAKHEHTVSAGSYLNTLAVTSLIGAAVAATGDVDPWHRAADAIEIYLETWRDRIDFLKARVGLPERLMLLGRGPSMAAALYGALMIKEAAKWPVEAMNAAQFRHGPLELADERLTAFIFAGHQKTARERNLRLARDLERCGGKPFWLDHEPPIDLRHIPLPAAYGPALAAVEIVPLQLLGIAIAEQSGIEAGSFRHLEKVTTVE